MTISGIVHLAVLESESAALYLHTSPHTVIFPLSGFSRAEARPLNPVTEMVQPPANEQVTAEDEAEPRAVVKSLVESIVIDLALNDSTGSEPFNS